MLSACRLAKHCFTRNLCTNHLLSSGRLTQSDAAETQIAAAPCNTLVLAEYDARGKPKVR